MGGSYVDKVAAVMRGHHFLNRGVGGDTSLNLYRRIQQDVIEERPDGAFVMVGLNDAVSLVEPNTRPYYRFVKRIPGGLVSALSFRENMRAILGRLSAAGIRTWVALEPIEYNPEQVSALRTMNDYALEVCQEMGIPTLDLMARLTPQDVPVRPPYNASDYRRNLLIKLGLRRFDQWQAEGGYSYTFDGVHLTEAGAQRVADLIVPFLRANGVK